MHVTWIGVKESSVQCILSSRHSSRYVTRYRGFKVNTSLVMSVPVEERGLFLCCILQWRNRNILIQDLGEKSCN